jgi:hypothetical protein
MKQALVLAIASFGLVAAASAQPPTATPTPGPHDPNPPMETPDLRLPPPCAPTTNLATGRIVVKPVATKAEPISGNRITPVDSSDGNTRCATNTAPQRADLPG